MDLMVTSWNLLAFLTARRHYFWIHLSKIDNLCQNHHDYGYYDHHAHHNDDAEQYGEIEITMMRQNFFHDMKSL